MLCRRCSGLDSTPQAGQRGARPPAIPRVLPVVSCERCGAVLGPDDLTAEHVAVLVELNRFGLTGRDGLLKAAPPEPEAR